MSDDVSDREPGLFGWSPPPPRGQGRPPFVWTREKANRIMLLFAAGHQVKAVASVIGCDAKTLRKVFPVECAARLKAELIVRSGMMAQLLTEAEKGNVGAVKQLDKMIEAEKVRSLNAKVKDRGRAETPAPAGPLGKKEAARNAAKGLKGRFETRTPPPGLLMN